MDYFFLFFKSIVFVSLGFFFYFSYRRGLNLFYALLGLLLAFLQDMGFLSVQLILARIVGVLFGCGLAYYFIAQKVQDESLVQQITKTNPLNQINRINSQPATTQLKETPLPQTNRKREILASVLYQLFGKGLYIHEVKHQVFFKRKLLYIFCFGYSWLSFINIITRSWEDARWFHNKTAVGAGSIFVAWIIVYVIGMIDVVSMSYRYREILSFNKKT